MLGRLGQADTGKLSLKDASHAVLSAKLDEDGRVSAEIEVLETEAGNTLSDWLASGNVEIVPFGIGSLQDGVVGEDYKFTRFDIVRKEEEPAGTGEE